MERRFDASPMPPEITHAVSPSVLTPAAVIQTYDDVEWEQFALEWATAFDPPYAHLDRIGGAGDKGRDIVAYAGDPSSDCDLDIYQCKHFAHPIQPHEIWRELGKLCVFTHRGAYRVPRRYRIIAPRGVGGSLADLLAQPERLREGLIREWDAKCRTRISQSEEILLEGALLEHIRQFDFRVVGYIPVHELLAQHRTTPHWLRRFRRDPPARPPADPVPAEVQPEELRYVTQLLEAYSDSLKSRIPDLASLAAHPDLAGHFKRARTDFFMAESLNRFYRDPFPPGAFDDVKTQVYDGVVETATASHACGYTRVQETVKAAIHVPLAQTDYTPYVQPGDRKGICHHLANDDKLTWVRP
ncbi:MAG: hypothetical protein IT431_15580 [Phycisphaerales bacterium]|nr:hypothetical protein [Phycisphaerales bacterium]